MNTKPIPARRSQPDQKLENLKRRSKPVALQYRAFISYSHADAAWAKWLHRWLESFRGDKDLIGRDAAGTIHKTLRPIYRDPGELTVGSPSEETLAALDASRALIVICSPASAQSSYVAEQVRLFKSRHPGRPVIPLIVDGKLGDPELDCFPPTLKFKLDAEGQITHEAIEVQAADAREGGDGEPRALAKIVAGLLGVSSEEVFRRSERGFRSIKREGRRQARIASIKDGIKFGMKGGFVVAVLALIALTSVWVYFDYQRRQQLAAIDALIAKYGAINSAGTSAPEGGPTVTEAISSIINGVTLEPRYAKAQELIKAGKYQDAEPLLQAVAEDKKRLASSEEAAEAFRTLASITSILDHDKARGYYAEAASLDPNHVEGMFWNGWLQAEAGSLAEAETAYRRVVSTAKEGTDDWALYWARLAVGDIRLSRGDLSGATAEYQGANAMADRVADADTAGWQRDLPIAYLKVGDVLLAHGNLAEALKTYRKGLAMTERLAEDDPDNPNWQRNLVASYGRVGSVLAQQGETILARDTLYRGRAIVVQLKDQLADDTQLPKRLTAFDAEIAKLKEAQTAERGSAQSELVAR